MSLSVFQPGSFHGTHTTWSSGPFSSAILNSPIALVSTTQPGNVGSDTHTSTSSGSPSGAIVSGT